MKLEELRDAWRSATAEAATPVARDQLVAHACRRVERLWAVVFRRDMIETAAAMLVMYFFIRQGWNVNAMLLERVGAWVVVAGAAYVVYRLHAARFGKPHAGLDAPVREFCQTELERLETQIHLLRTVLVWYVNPLMGGLVLMALGRHGLTPPLLIELAIFAFVGWCVHAVNQRAVRVDLIPLKQELDALLEELEDSQ